MTQISASISYNYLYAWEEDTLDGLMSLQGECLSALATT